jgi:hypothetical protein
MFETRLRILLPNLLRVLAVLPQFVLCPGRCKLCRTRNNESVKQHNLPENSGIINSLAHACMDVTSNKPNAADWKENAEDDCCLNHIKSSSPSPSS